jgi:hypothetical protein
MEKILHKYNSFEEQEMEEIKFWQNLSGGKKLEILENIRANYWAMHNGTPQRLQRIYRIIEQI